MLARARVSNYARVDDSSIASDASEELQHDIFVRASLKLPEVQTTHYFGRPRFEAAIKAIEVFSSVSLVALQISAVVLLSHKVSSIAPGNILALRNDFDLI